MNLFLELYRHDRLSLRRSPFREQSRVTRLLMYLFAGFWVCYLIFFGIMLAFTLDGGAVEPYHIMNSGLPVVLILDFLMRTTFQKTATQEVKPYLLLPVKRRRLTDFMLLRSALSTYNLLWLAMFIPFGVLTVSRFYGLWGVATFCVGIWLLTVANSYLFQMSKMLIGGNPAWTLLPIAVYGGAVADMLLTPRGHSDFFRDLGEGFITGNLLWFAGTLAVIALLFLADRWLTERLMYSELNKVSDSRVRHVTDYRFLERLGGIGEYMRLELKMLLRNKVCRQQLMFISVIVIAFSLAIGFSDVYQGGMKLFLIIYNYVVYGTMFLGNLMSFEGNYIDGLMSRRESLYTLLRAKYLLYSAAMFIPTLFLIPAMVTGSVSPLTCFAWQLFTSGPVFCCLFQMAVYNKRTMPMNERMTNRNYSGTGTQNLISLIGLGLPILIGFSLKAVMGEAASEWLLLAVGLAFTLTSSLWLRNVYRRFMARRYINMEGFRDSRQK